MVVGALRIRNERIVLPYRRALTGGNPTANLMRRVVGRTAEVPERLTISRV